MKHISLITILLLIVTSSSNCKKNKLSELDKLPPATQTGAKTFGCLVNGKAWIPGIDDWSSPGPLKFYYYTDSGGQFSISARYQNSSKNIDETISLGIDSIHTNNEYKQEDIYANTIRFLVLNTKNEVTCRYISSMDIDVNATGFVKITRIDIAAGIISGTFEVTFRKGGCQLIEITNGRFDAKL